MATASLVYANKDGLLTIIDSISRVGIVQAMANTKNTYYKKFVNRDQIIKDIEYFAGGYVLGEVAKKYAPGVIKRPLGKISKKIPRVI